MLGRSVYALILGLALGVLVAGGGVYAASQRPPTPGPARGDLDAPFTIALTVTEPFLAALINEPPASSSGTPAPARQQLRNATVRLAPDGMIRVSGETTVRGVTAPIRATLLPRVVDGQIEMAIVEGRVGGFGLPTTIAADVAAAINRQLRATAARREVAVVAIAPGEGMLTVRLR